MKCDGYLTVNSRGSAKFSKTKLGLNWDELSIKVSFDIPVDLFRIPLIEAKITVSKDIIPKPQPVDLILNTKDLIEQSTGAKINFTVIPFDEVKENG